MAYKDGTPLTLPTDLEDDVDDVLASHQNDPNTEIDSIRSTLGSAPTLLGGQADLASRLAQLGSFATLIGSFSNLVNRLANFLDDGLVKTGGGLVGETRGLYVKNNSADVAHDLDVDVDEVVLKRSTGGRITVENPALITMAIDAAGVNGLDSGSVAANTWYYVWVIYNGPALAGLFSASPTTPTLPSGYTYSALVGAVRTSGSSNLHAIVQSGRRIDYQTARELDSGNVGDGSWTTLNFATLGMVPPLAKRVHGILAVDSGSGQAGVTNNNSIASALGTGRGAADIIESQNANRQYFDFVFLNAQNLYWASNNANARIALLGFDF